MNWSDERYVRLYTRDSATWLRWTWEARAIFCLLLRKVDRSGVLDTGSGDQTEALALLLDIPTQVAAQVLPQWLVNGTMVQTPTALVLPKFIEAQEARQSDRARQRESREKRLAAASAQNVELPCHTPSQPVTPAVPSRTVPSRTVKAAAPASRAPRESDALCAAFLEATGSAYVWNGAKDGAALAHLRKHVGLDEVMARWRAGLAASGWMQVRTVAQLRQKWNDLAAPDNADARSGYLDGTKGEGENSARRIL